VSQPARAAGQDFRTSDRILAPMGSVAVTPGTLSAEELDRESGESKDGGVLVIPRSRRIVMS
jgi:hypothetical protein